MQGAWITSHSNRHSPEQLVERLCTMVGHEATRCIASASTFASHPTCAHVRRTSASDGNRRMSDCQLGSKHCTHRASHAAWHFSEQVVTMAVASSGHWATKSSTAPSVTDGIEQSRPHLSCSAFRLLDVRLRVDITHEKCDANFTANRSKANTSCREPCRRCACLGRSCRRQRECWRVHVALR